MPHLRKIQVQSIKKPVGYWFLNNLQYRLLTSQPDYKLKERVHASLQVSMVVCLKTPLFWGMTPSHLKEFLFSNNFAWQWLWKFYCHVSWDFYVMKTNLIPQNGFFLNPAKQITKLSNTSKEENINCWNIVTSIFFPHNEI